MYFPSRRGWFIGIFIWGVISFALYKAIESAYDAFNISSLIVIIAVWVPVLIFISIVWFGTGYKIRDNHLQLKIGSVLMTEISISSIHSIERSYNPLAAPANSLKKLKLTYSKGVCLVSPRDEKTFIAQLSNIQPAIKVLGNI